MVTTKQALQFVDLPVNAPDRGGKIAHVSAGWLNKYHNRVLLDLLVLMYLAVFTFYAYGKVNPDMYMIGVISGLSFHLFTGVNDWQRFNRTGRGISQLQTTRKQIAIKFLFIISLIVFIVFLVTNITGGIAFVSGTMVFAWIKFLELLYWEHKNRKILIVDKTSFYAVDVDRERG
ncbi:MAG TPA: DUF1673 family protein [Methanosarcinaceae archaeon]|nr:DUF1673 family protein [Methanosarcinaceae archaeon]